MINFLEILRRADFNSYRFLYKFSEQHLFVEKVFYFFSQYGIVIIFLSFIYLIWRQKIRAFFCSFFAMGYAAAVDLIIMFFWHRPGPYVSHADLVKIAAEGTRMSVASFPSSHTYIAFAVATSIFLYGHKRLGIALFLLAVMVGVGRIGIGFHYPTDVIGGAIIGIITGVLAYLSVQKVEEDQKVS